MAVGLPGAVRRRRVARAPLLGRVVGLDDPALEPEVAGGTLERRRPLRRVHEVADAGDVGEARVPECGEVLHRLGHDLALVMPNRWYLLIFKGAADDHGGKSKADELVDAGVVDAQVEDEDAVHPVLAEPAPVHRDLLLDVADELDRQSDRMLGELELGAGDELHEERLERDRAGGSG